MILLTAILLAGCGPVDLTGPQVELARAIGTAAEANRSAFRFGAVKFRYTVGYADSLDEAIAGRLTKGYPTEGSLAFNERRGRYEVVHSLENMVADRVQLGPTRWSSILRSDRVLTDGKVTLFDGIGADEPGTGLIHTAQITPGLDRYHLGFDMPLYVGHRDPDRFEWVVRDLKIAGSNSEFLKLTAVREGARSAGREVVDLVLTAPEGQRTYSVDLERGAIPLRQHDDLKNGRKIWEFYDDLRPMEGAGWFPHRKLYYDRDPGNRYGGLVHDLVVTEADFSRKPPDSAFTLTFPEPRPIYNQVTAETHPPQATWDLARLPKPAARPVAAELPSGPGPVMAGPRAGGRAGPVALVGLGVALLVGAGIAYRRHSGGR